MSSSDDDLEKLKFTSTNSSSSVEMRATIERLRVQLEEEKMSSKQAAEYGLSLLEDFKKLQSRNFELEGEIETCKSELEATNLALSKVKQSKKLEDAKDLNLEDSWMMESANREEKLTRHLTTIELELNRNKQELERVYSENEKLANTHQELSQQHDQLKDGMVKQRAEIKALKERENRLLVDNTELDGENVQLQEQIVRLKEDLVELDTLRHENKALEEKVEMLDSQIVELSTLKRIVEKQLQESLNSFREEREHKYQKKRDAQERREKQSLRELNDLAKDLNKTWMPIKSINEISSDEDEYVGDDDDDDDGRVETTIDQGQLMMNGSNKGSLFDEIVLLEKKCEEIGKHKSQLENELNEFRADLGCIISSVHGLSKHLVLGESGEITSNEMNQQSSQIGGGAGGGGGTEDRLGKQAVGQVETFKKDFDKFMVSVRTLKLSEKLDSTHFLNEDLVNIFKSVEQMNQEYASTTTNTTTTTPLVNTNTEPENNPSSPSITNNSENQSPPPITITAQSSSKTLIESINLQLKLLKSNLDKQASGTTKIENSTANSTSQLLPSDIQELQDQIIKLKSLLSTKREQIATLRTVLKANKQTAEVALANLKSKYENEKLVVTETMQKLRNELKTLKEDAATFATLRAMFTARCDEYVAQLDESQRMLVAAEEEKKTLNSLLRLAIQQKLKLTQRLEDLEMDNERVINPPPTTVVSNGSALLSSSNSINLKSSSKMAMTTSLTSMSQNTFTPISNANMMEENTSGNTDLNDEQKPTESNTSANTNTQDPSNQDNGFRTNLHRKLKNIVS